MVNPTEINKYAHYAPYTSDDGPALYQEQVAAMTPNQVLRFFETKRRDAHATAAFLFLVGAAIATYSAIEEKQEREKEYPNVNDKKKPITRELVTSTSLIATDLLTDVALAGGQQATTELQFLPEELLEEGMIFPGEKRSGKIFFRRSTEIQRYHRIVCTVGNTDFLFDFRRAKVKEKRFLTRRLLNE